MKHIHRISIPCAAAVLALSLSSAWAQSGGTSGTSGSASGSTSAAPTTQPGSGTRNTPKADKLARADRKFMEDAAASGLFEQQAAQLASTKATDRAVKDYASMLAEHHSTANNELMQLAASLGLELPPAPTRSMRNELERMGKKTGAEFDREFVRTVGVKEHERDIKRFQKASKEVKEPQLKAWVDKTLPTLEQHLAQATKLPEAGRDQAAAARSGQGQGQQGSSMGAGPSNPPTTSPNTGGAGGGTSPRY